MAIGDHAVEIKDHGLQHTSRREEIAAQINALLSARAHHALAYRCENGVSSTKMRVFHMLHIRRGHNQTQLAKLFHAAAVEAGENHRGRTRFARRFKPEPYIL